MTRKPPVKMPVPSLLRCGMLMPKGNCCERRATCEMTREDDTKQQLCDRCAMKMRDLHESFPTIYGKLRFSFFDKLVRGI
jgi:hypothetical protein